MQCWEHFYVWVDSTGIWQTETVENCQSSVCDMFVFINTPSISSQMSPIWKLEIFQLLAKMVPPVLWDPKLLAKNLRTFQRNGLVRRVPTAAIVESFVDDRMVVSSVHDEATLGIHSSLIVFERSRRSQQQWYLTKFVRHIMTGGRHSPWRNAVWGGRCLLGCCQRLCAPKNKI